MQVKFVATYFDHLVSRKLKLDRIHPFSRFETPIKPSLQFSRQTAHVVKFVGFAFSDSGTNPLLGSHYLCP